MTVFPKNEHDPLNAARHSYRQARYIIWMLCIVIVASIITIIAAAIQINQGRCG